LGRGQQRSETYPSFEYKRRLDQGGPDVFEAPLGFDPLPEEKFKRMLFEEGRLSFSHGVIPFIPLVVRGKGRVEVDGGSCAVCHTRVMPDGDHLRGARQLPD
jgi:hypothetical protein